MAVVVALALAGDIAAACFVGGVLRCAVREALLTRRPSDGGFPSAALDAVVAAATLKPRDVDRVIAIGTVADRPLARLGGFVRSLRGRRGGEGARVRYHEATTGPPSPAALARALGSAGFPAAVELAASDGGAARLIDAARAADPSLRLPESPYFGLDFSDMEAYRALSNGGLPRQRVGDVEARAREAVGRGEVVVWARGPAAFLDAPLGPRVILRAGGVELLRSPDGLPALSPVDVVRAWRQSPGARLILGDYWV